MGGAASRGVWDRLMLRGWGSSPVVPRTTREGLVGNPDSAPRPAPDRPTRDLGGRGACLCHRMLQGSPAGRGGVVRQGLSPEVTWGGFLVDRGCAGTRGPRAGSWEPGLSLEPALDHIWSRSTNLGPLGTETVGGWCSPRLSRVVSAALGPAHTLSPLPVTTCLSGEEIVQTISGPQYGRPRPGDALGTVGMPRVPAPCLAREAPHPRAPSQRQAGGVEGRVLLWLCGVASAV